jgi:hypothetical protein
MARPASYLTQLTQSDGSVNTSIKNSRQEMVRTTASVEPASINVDVIFRTSPAAMNVMASRLR